MNQTKIGGLIKTLRTEKKLTQKALADRMNISDKAVSKWERGLGCPDVSLLPLLCAILGVDLENLLSGELSENDTVGGNMKKIQFYTCPVCGNLVTSTSDASVSCCGKKLEPMEMQKASDAEKLNVENIENDYFISSDHEMTKEHYISFVAFVTGDSVLIRKTYPEWNLQTRIPRFGRGLLIYHCVKHGLFWQTL